MRGMKWKEERKCKKKRKTKGVMKEKWKIRGIVEREAVEEVGDERGRGRGI